jgi:hypothetical protein
MLGTSISIEGLDKAAVLAALYNVAKVMGNGIVSYDPKPMTIEEAAKLLKEHTSFHYIKGRFMKVYLGPDELDTTHYNLVHGPGAAERIIEALRQQQG